ncbi:hypothetical protein ES703_11326 [subsurface metagenome]
MDVKHKAHPILLMNLMIQRKYNKDYSFPSQEKMIELLDLRQGYKKSRATLNRWMRVIEDSKYLIRRRRIRRDHKRGMIFKSTLYKIPIKGYRLLARFGVDVSKEIAKYQRWLEEINPDIKQKRLRKQYAAEKHNPRHTEFIKKILNGLGRAVSFIV